MNRGVGEGRDVLRRGCRHRARRVARRATARVGRWPVLVRAPLVAPARPTEHEVDPVPSMPARRVPATRGRGDAHRPSVCFWREDRTPRSPARSCDRTTDSPGTPRQSGAVRVARRCWRLGRRAPCHPRVCAPRESVAARPTLEAPCSCRRRWGRAARAARRRQRSARRVGRECPPACRWRLPGSCQELRAVALAEPTVAQPHEHCERDGDQHQR